MWLQDSVGLGLGLGSKVTPEHSYITRTPCCTCHSFSTHFYTHFCNKVCVCVCVCVFKYIWWQTLREAKDSLLDSLNPKRLNRRCSVVRVCVSVSVCVCVVVCAQQW